MSDTYPWEQYPLHELEEKGIATLGRGNIISKKDIQSNPGGFPIYSSSAKGEGLFGTYGDYMFDDEMITWSVDGGGNLFYRPRHKFSVTNVSGYMRLDTSVLDYRFAHASLVLQHSKLTFDYQTKAHPSVIRNLYHLPIPPLPEQKKIAEILSGIDTMISAKSIRHEKRKTTAYLILDSVLSNAELRQAPLSDIALLERGKFSHRPRNDPDYYGGEYPFIQTGDIPKTGIRISEHKQTLNRKGLEVSRQFPSGTIVITIAATIGEVGILSYPACFPDSIVGITPNTEECDAVFLLYSLRRLKDKLLQMAPQSAQSNLNLEILGKLDVPLPPLYEQRKFAQMICCEDERATAEVIGIRKLHDMKAAVASDLLSGRKRVSI